MRKSNPFRYFKASSEVIRLAVMMYIRVPLSRLNVEDLLHERGIDISHETVRFWWNRSAELAEWQRLSNLQARSRWVNSLRAVR